MSAEPLVHVRRKPYLESARVKLGFELNEIKYAGRYRVCLDRVQVCRISNFNAYSLSIDFS